MRVEIVIALVCSAVTLLGVVYLGAQFFDSSPPPSQPQAKGIVWAGRTFVDLAEFSRWLRSQGVPYEVWALRHPTRAGIAQLRPPTIPQAERAAAERSRSPLDLDDAWPAWPSSSPPSPFSLGSAAAAGCPG